MFRLTTAPDQSTKHTVVSLMDEGVYGARLRAAGVDVHTLGMPRGRFSLRAFTTLRRLIARQRPDVVQTWMYHANLVGGVAARTAGIRAVAWGIHNSGAYLEMTSATARIVLKLCARLSRWVPKAIVVCGHCAAERHRAAGYDGARLTVVTNGYDLGRFAPDAEARERLRGEWGVSPTAPLIGSVARWDPLKDHENLLEALALLSARGRDVRCVLVGRDMSEENAALMALVERVGVRPSVIFAGPRDDVPAVMSALDVHVLSSRAEGFPNVVAEAMACGTPCVVTRVGDAEVMVGDTGWVAPPERPDALADAIESALDVIATATRDDVGDRCRARVEHEFSLTRMVAGYDRVWSGLLGNPYR